MRSGSRGMARVLEIDADGPASDAVGRRADDSVHGPASQAFHVSSKGARTEKILALRPDKSYVYE